ncbi:MAG: hypothetical protein HY078_12845 [Elusimicrobia bacterium]|nr:hypothetical protein [Elusimicrobiota bacterium]
MNLLNRYFTPFAAILILLAVVFSEVDRRTIYLAVGVWGVSLAVNWWFAANTYHFVGWANRLKALQVWLNFVWAVPLFYLLHGFWGPMWLLFVMAPVTAALYQGRMATLGTSLVSAGTMLGLYWMHGLEGPAWGMAVSHAAFIVLFSLFIHALADTALRLASR